MILELGRKKIRELRLKNFKNLKIQSEKKRADGALFCVWRLKCILN